jgi:hypothetical protein
MVWKEFSMSWDPTQRPIFTPEFWAKRLADAEASGEVFQAVFKTDRDTWARIQAKHAAILAKYIEPTDGILDAGCSWGRLLDIMPANWVGVYHGIDIADAFIAKARRDYRHLLPRVTFAVGDLRNLSTLTCGDVRWFDWGIVCSVKRVIIGHAGQGVWDGIETQLRLLCKRLLILDYDPEDEEEVIG